ncbi:MAG: DUF2752 domain-containing protein [Candidatus Dormibacteraceae bacterium]
MPESLARISQQSAPRPALRRVVVAPAMSGDRWFAWSLLGLGLPWLVYTRLYFFLQPRHLTYDGGAFMWLFNKPDPGCGLTRTFAWMWRGDLGRAVAVYPLGPLVFLATVALAVYAVVVLLGGRAVHVNLSPATVRFVLGVGVVALGLNWIAKLAWLGM